MFMKEKNKIALITGCTGQDGSYLAELLLSKNYEVHGLVRRSSSMNRERINHIKNLSLHYGDLADESSIREIIEKIKPDEIYNLAAQSHVKISFEIPEYTSNITGLGPLRILEAIKDYQERTNKKIKFYQASSSEMFGSSPPPQNEKTVFNPQSPYAAAKVFAHQATKLYRQAYGIFAVSGILFNHESPRRGENFVTRKITQGAAKIKLGLEKKLYLGNLSAKRDWGYAKEYMEAAWHMMQQSKPDDFVIGTGETHTVKELLEEVFKLAGLGNYKKYVVIDKKYYRPAEVNYLAADISKAKRNLSWKPKTKFKDLIRLMYESDLEKLTQETLLLNAKIFKK
jgi:GDPmannose 4,6-dehydratase